MVELTQTIIGIFTKGGVVMIPLVLFSLAALMVSIEKFYSLRPSKVLPEELSNRVEMAVKDGNISDAVAICSSNPANMAQVYYAGLVKASNDSSTEAIEKSIESAGRNEQIVLSKGLNLLNIVASVSPLLGLLGTVIGMIKTFSVIQMQGLANTENLAGGISEALISTAAGLSIAIPYFVAFKYFRGRVEKLVGRMEENAETLVDLITAKRQVKRNDL